MTRSLVAGGGIFLLFSGVFGVLCYVLNTAEGGTREPGPEADRANARRAFCTAALIIACIGAALVLMGLMFI